MKAILSNSPGGPEVLHIANADAPAIGHNDVLLDVLTAGINRADLLQRAGHYPPPTGASPILGLEVCGTVSAYGAGVTGLQVGQRVVALLQGGGYAEQVAVDAGLVLVAPEVLNDQQSAAIMEAACTVISALDQLNVSNGQNILIYGGAGGIGSLAIPLAKARGAHVITTASDESKILFCRERGADQVIDYRTENVADRMQQLGGADAILDILGAAALEDNLRCLNPDGRLHIIGLQRGTTSSLNLGLVMQKRLQISGSTLRGRPLAQRVHVVQRVKEEVWPLVERGLRPPVHQVFPLAQTADAHRLMESGEHRGKIVLQVSER